jgi:hypothetical protein
MTVHVSKWLLWGLVAVGAVGAGAYLLAHSADEDDPALASGATDPARPESSEAPPPDCSRRAAKDAALDTEFEARVRELGVVQAGDPLFGEPGYFVTELICRDLTADGAEDMVVRLDCCAGGTPTPWAIFLADDDAWRLGLYRAGIQASLKIEGDAVVERSAAYGAGEPICCPTTARRGRVRWTGNAFEFRSDDASANRDIKISNDGVERLGEFRPATGSPAEAANAFGPPSYVLPRDEFCVHEWRDLGLLINFANLGGLDPCTADVRAAGIELKDEFAAQARWKTDRGVRVGMSLQELRDIYPDARTQSFPGLGTVVALISSQALVGVEGAGPVLSARIAEGAVDELRMLVGTAPE